MEEADIIKNAWLVGCDVDDLDILRKMIKDPKKVSRQDQAWFIETFADNGQSEIAEYLKKLCK